MANQIQAFFQFHSYLRFVSFLVLVQLIVCLTRGHRIVLLSLACLLLQFVLKKFIKLALIPFGSSISENNI